jgi:hypothetical protein
MELFGAFVFWVLLCIGVAVLARNRGRSAVGYFLLSIVFSPVLGLIVVLVSRNLVEEARKDDLRRADDQRQLAAIAALAPSSGVADEIDKLLRLKERGALTDGEFATQKAKLLERAR